MNKRALLKIPFDSLFGRMALISMIVLFAVQAGWFAVLTAQRRHHDADGYARGLLLVLEAVHSDTSHGAHLAPALHTHLVPTWNMPATVKLENPAATPIAMLARKLAADLPAGVQIAADVDPQHTVRLWVRYPDSNNWIVTPVDLPPPKPILVESVSMLVGALLLSFVAAWQLQRPLSRVAQVARHFGGGRRAAPVVERGPRELRDLIRAFNQMMQQINETDDERAVMLAGIAHDLKAPLTRLKLRASVTAGGNEETRAQFIRDIDSLTRIVQQFLEFAASAPAAGPDVGVDDFLAEQFSLPEDDDAPLFVLALAAGPAFRLPRTLIDRLATNLVDNALEHGEPPVEISTQRDGDDWVLMVRDHGRGIPPARIEDALKPFVRLDPARAGDGHCGLGLAIVTRLARDLGGRCVIENAAGGGLAVRIAVPAQTPRALPGRPSPYDSSRAGARLATA